jgi:hypothetical protein
VRPLRHPLVPAGPGHRTPQTLLLLDERDKLLREARARFCIGMSDRAAAKFLRDHLGRYRQGRWRRDAACLTCPPQHHGRLEQVMFCILKSRDHVPSEMTIRRSLFS